MQPMQFEPLAPVPAVTLARQLRKIPLFRFVSIDELFRIATIAQQVRYSPDAKVQEKGNPAQFIQVLLEGRFVTRDEGDGEQTLEPPAMLGFREVLEGTSIQTEAQAVGESIALAMPAEEFRTLLSANIELAQGLFRILLERRAGDGAPSRVEMSAVTTLAASEGPLKTVDKALVLQTVPLFARATGEELFALASIAHERALEPGDQLFSEGHPTSVWLMLEGDVDLASSAGEVSETVGPGSCFGIEETLAAADWGWRATVKNRGTALHIEREALFELLSDRMGLLQAIFGAIFLEGSKARRETIAFTAD